MVAGFTPTVASITEQNSLEIIESLSDNVAETSTAKPTTSTVPDVVYDEHGQTWDVYGAEFDPDILGQAIQSYLEKIMARKAQSKPTNGQPLQSEKMTVEEAGLKEDPGRQSRVGGGREGSRQRQRDRALSFVMRYLCTSIWRPGRTAR